MNMLSKKNIKQRINDLFKVCRVFSMVMSTLLVALIISTLIHYDVIITFVTNSAATARVKFTTAPLEAW